jgi:hypothetical protein
VDPGTKPSGMETMTSVEIWRVAETRAIEQGALKPQGLQENIAAGIGASNHGPGWWASTNAAQSRLRQWTIEILRGWGYNVVDQ